MKKRGFTLIEILAVIVVLAVIALITIPIITDVIEKSRMGAFKDSVLSAFHQIDYDLIENNLGEIPEKGIEVTNLNLKNNHFKYGTFYQKEKLEVSNISDGKYCAIGTMDNLLVFKGECDLTTPRCSLKIEGEKGSNDWYYENPKVIMETSEAFTGGLKYGIGKEENYSKEVSKGKKGKAEYQTNETTTTRVYCYVKNIGDNKGTNYIDVKIDKTEPEEAKLSYTSTSNSITVIASGKDSESGIVRYQFSKDGGTTWTNIQEGNSYTFNNLKNGEYDIKIKVYNGTYVEKKGPNNLYKESETVKVTTSTMTNPTIAQTSQVPASGYTWATKRVMKITYTNSNVVDPVYYFKSSVEATVPSGIVTGSCGTGTNPGTCTTSSVTTLTSGTWYKTNSTTPSITYNANGNLYAAMGDGTNLSGTASMTISKVSTGTPTAPVIAGGNNNWTGESRTIYVRTASTETSGILKYQYYISTSNSNLSGGSWKDCSTSTTSQIITTEGTRYISFRAIGNNGEIGEISGINTTKIDKTNPTVSVKVNGKVATFTIKDNIGAVGYGVNQSATEAPTYTTFTSTKETTKTYEGTTAGEYIVWVKDNAGRTAKATFTLAQTAFSYKATETTSTYTATYSKSNCTWAPCCPGASGCPSSCTRGSCPSQCVCNCNGSSATSTCYPTGTCESCSWAYTCPQGGTLSGTTCTKIEYSCPNGGILNDTTHMCEF